MATVYYRNKKYKEAIALLRRCPEKTNLDVREQLGLSMYKLSSPPPAEALKLLEAVVEARPESTGAELQLGLHFLRSDPKRAAEGFSAYLRYKPANTPAQVEEEVRLKLAQALLLAKEWDLALKELETLARSKPKDLNLKLLIGAAQSGKCQNSDARACSQCITVYEKVLGDAARNPSIYINLGNCYLKNNRPSDSQREADLYTKAKGQDYRGWVLLGESYEGQNRHDKAESAYITARNLDKSPSTLCKLGRTHVRLKNYDAAVSELEQCTNADTSLASEYLCDLVEPYTAKKLKDKLQSVGDKLAPSTRDLKAQKCAAEAYYANASYDKAAGAYQAALAIEPNSGQAKSGLVKVLNLRASQLVDKGDHSKALGPLLEAERLTPDDIMTNRNLGLVYLLNKRWADAENALRRALSKVPSDIIVNRLLGRALLGQGQRPRAREAYEKAVQEALRKGAKGPELATVWTELSSLYLEAGQHDQAVTVLEQALLQAGPGMTTSTQRNLSIAYFERGRERLRDPKQVEGALEDIVRASQAPKGTFSNKESAAIACFEWNAALKAGKVQQAEEAIARAKAGGGCSLKAPHDKLGLSFLEAYTNYRDTLGPAKREASAKTFQSLSGRASGGTKDWLLQLARSAYELAGFDWFNRGDEKRAEAGLRAASRTPAKGDRRVLDHNLAVTEMMNGRTAQAEKAFEGMAGRPPESLLNQGILRDRAGDGKAALQLYERAWDKGVHTQKVRDWIDVKKRLWGGP